MAQSLMTLILTGLLLLGQSLGIYTSPQPKTVDDLVSAFNDLRASFLETPGSPAGAANEESSKGAASVESSKSGAHESADSIANVDDDSSVDAGVTIESYVIGQGEDWETTYWIVDSGVEGPTVMVVGGLHGDEPAVLLAGERLVEAVGDLARGRVILLPKANVPAITAKKRLVGTDLNRAFPQDPSDAFESPLAEAIWQLVREYQPEWLIDLHDESSDLTGQTVTHHPAQQEAAWAARAMAEALTAQDSDGQAAGQDSDAAFTPASGLAEGSLAHAAAEQLDVRALALETHRRFSLTQRAEWLISGTTYLLTYLGMR